MRRAIAFGLVLTMGLGAPAGVFAAGRPAARQQNQTGTVKGEAKNAQGEKLVQNKVRIRNSSTGEISADLTTDAAGSFIGSVPAGSYVVEIVGANGTVIGLSPVFTVAAGSTAAISVTATSVAAVAAAGATAGGLSVFGLGTVTSIAIIGGAATAGVIAIKAVKKDASPSGQ
jgi:hypothetical protein